MKRSSGWIGLVVVSMTLGARCARAQSTLFNIPTTDTVARGKIYLELDYLAQAPRPDDLPGGAAADRLRVFVPRLVVGLGGNVEIGANFATVHLGDTNQASLQPNVKWKFFSNARGLAAAGGTILYTPLNHRDVADTYALVYASLSKKVDHAYGPRLHIGPYRVVGANDSFTGARAGVIAGLEQPLHPRVTVVADWLSGENGFGYLTPGISFALPAGSVFNAGYSFGNDTFANHNATHNRLWFFYYGITF